jgi:hypothetical protein
MYLESFERNRPLLICRPSSWRQCGNTFPNEDQTGSLGIRQSCNKVPLCLSCDSARQIIFDEKCFFFFF